MFYSQYKRLDLLTLFYSQYRLLDLLTLFSTANTDFEILTLFSTANTDFEILTLFSTAYTDVVLQARHILDLSTLFYSQYRLFDVLHPIQTRDYSRFSRAIVIMILTLLYGQ